MNVTSRDIVAILKTIRELGYRRFRLQHGDLTLEVDAESGRPEHRSSVASAALVAPPPAPPSQAPSRAPKTAPLPSRPPKEGAVAIKAPMTGTFYRAPSPGAPPFIEVGSRVEAAQIVCIIEVMKLFNSIPAGVAGRVIAVCAENESPVAAGQAVMWIDPVG